MTPVTIPWSPRLQAYNPSDDDERPLRRGLAWDLLGQMGLLGAPGVQVVDPPGMSDEGLARVHAPAYIQAVKRYSAQPQMALAFEASQWGFIPGQDTVARAGMHEAAADVCGASVAGAQAVWEGGPGSRAFCPAPSGLHHAFANKASGFCIYNDCALAVAWLLDAGAGRVAYVDLDAHHGNGVQWIFHDDPRVLTVSVHEFAYGFYPGTGDVTERGPVGTPDTTVNVPLPPFAGDLAMLAAVDRVVDPAVRAFDPDVLVVHLGADVHHADPLTHLQMTMAGMEEMYRRVVALADQVGILPELTIFPQMRVPTGSPAFTSDEVLPGMNFVYAWRVARRLEIECNTNVNRRRDPGLGSFYTEYLQTFNFEYDLSERVMLFNEFVIFWPVGAVDVPGQSYSHAGLHLFLMPNLQIDVHAAVGLNAGAADMFGGSGLSWRW